METTVTDKAFSEDGTWEEKALRMRDLCRDMELGIAKLASINHSLCLEPTNLRSGLASKIPMNQPAYRWLAINNVTKS